MAHSSHTTVHLVNLISSWFLISRKLRPVAEAALSIHVVGRCRHAFDPRGNITQRDGGLAHCDVTVKGQLCNYDVIVQGVIT